MQGFETFSQYILSLPIGPLIAVVLVLVVFALLVLFVVVLQLGSRIRYLTYPVYDQIIKEAQKKANQLLDEAGEQARAIRTKAEMDASKLLVERKKENESLEQTYAQQIKDVAASSKELLEKQTAEMKRVSGETLESLRGYVASADAILKEEMGGVQGTLQEERERIKNGFSEMMRHMEDEHKKLLEENKQQVSQVLTQEIEAARTAIADYKKERLTAIDQGIVRLVEETTRIALGKTLTLEEHANIIEASLKEAKEEGIFGK